MERPIVKIDTKVISNNMGWCDDPTSRLYNKEIKIPSEVRHERLFKKTDLMIILSLLTIMQKV